MLDLHQTLNAINSYGKRREYYQGIYTVKNPQKYIGTHKPVYRSSYEKRCFEFFDANENILKWGSEVLTIPYMYDLDNRGRSHKYFVDIACTVKQKDGTVQKYAIEIKPKESLNPPQKPKNPTKKAMKNYLYSLATYVKNKNKWEAARKFCDGNGWKFVVLTEDHIFGGRMI